MNSSLDAFERLVARFTGPMHIRFIVQPVMAAILGIRDGIRDAKEGQTPFLCELCTRPESRSPQLKKALRRLIIPLPIAIILDAIVQYMLFRRVRVLGAVILGTAIMGLPYSLAREISNRVACSRSHAHFETPVGRG
jgi:Na+/H+-translocating membrane pyrophosphatase